MLNECVSTRLMEDNVQYPRGFERLCLCTHWGLARAVAVQNPLAKATSEPGRSGCSMRPIILLSLLLFALTAGWNIVSKFVVHGRC
ncbi:hypothetical protein K470DRAFT_30437 [Piedraia hortae CBS 480.64]|uniref:Uncharacterized protein n=1 Tax=Piedraia hortae CBS 480.64 TaxID=1314780 RepID=A0A6A7C3E8_9PEZI|nr:hypothetical protein K470DRAFT_30437 [Piedraia hortae CBS 480.64]